MIFCKANEVFFYKNIKGLVLIYKRRIKNEKRLMFYKIKLGLEKEVSVRKSSNSLGFRKRVRLSPWFETELGLGRCFSWERN